MKFFTYFFLLLTIASCSVARKGNQSGKRPIDTFVSKIERATLKHDMKAMKKLLDKEFFQMQYFDIHDENLVNLSNEYFCGEYQGKYKCLVFKEIKTIKAVKIAPPLDGDSNFTITFEVTNKKNETIQTTNTWVKKTTVDGKTVLGFFGPAG